MDYYKQTLYIPHVDKDDTVLGKVERWKAHREGILHRGFTVGVMFEDLFICQHRKHPVFGGYLDLTASSHPLYIGEKIQSFEEAVYNTLEREWSLKRDDLSEPLEEKGKAYYYSKHGEYIEHEMCYFFLTKATKLPLVNFEYAYGYSLLSLKDLEDTEAPYAGSVAPWVQEALRQGLLK